MRFLASTKDVRGGIAGVVGKGAKLFDDLCASATEHNEFVNQLRAEVRAWREDGHPGKALVTRRLLERWFERDEERKALGKRFFFCQQETVETPHVRDCVSGQPRGDGLDPTGEHNLYDGFDMVPPEYQEESQPDVLIYQVEQDPRTHLEGGARESRNRSLGYDDAHRT